jgi:hypothetical protein
MRATMSVLPPAANGTTTRTGLFGHAAPCAAASALAIANAHNIIARIVFIAESPPVGLRRPDHHR